MRRADRAGLSDPPWRGCLQSVSKLLQFDKPVSLGAIGDRFAFKRELGEDEQDPTTRSP
jgi:hypothetical protein